MCGLSFNQTGLNPAVRAGIEMFAKNAVSRMLLASAAVAGISGSASAAQVYWTNWTADTVGQTTGTATGTIASPQGAIGVSYKGEVTSQTVVNGTGATGYPSWGPSSTYADGTIVADAPNFHDLIAQNGGAGTGVNTITFSVPILDPVMSIWSLGNGGDDANYTFSGSEPFSIVAGGPSNEYGGSGLVPNGGADSVTGLEGNGTLQFIGTYSSITFTNSNFEDYYGFTLGVDGIAPPPTGVPEPGSLALVGAGLVAASLLRKRRS
jgi:hypothetical protein